MKEPQQINYESVEALPLIYSRYLNFGIFLTNDDEHKSANFIYVLTLDTSQPRKSESKFSQL